MRKLQFTAQYTQGPNQQAALEHQVQTLLLQKLGDLGFETLPQSGNHLAITVDRYTLPLSIICQSHDGEGSWVCEITSYPEEDQDWIDRIVERSLLNQLAQAVENTLKTDKRLSAFKWEND